MDPIIFCTLKSIEDFAVHLCISVRNVIFYFKYISVLKSEPTVKYYSNQRLYKGTRDKTRCRHAINPHIPTESGGDSVAYPQWLAFTGHVVRVRGVLGSKSGQDIMTSVPTSVFFHSSFSSFPHKNTRYSTLGLIIQNAHLKIL